MKRSFENILMINGTPRSGTTWLGQIIDSSPDVRYKYQPLFSRSFREQISLKSQEKEIMRFFEDVYNFKDDFLDREKEKDNNIHQRFEFKKEAPTTLSVKHVRYHYLLPHLLSSLNNLKICAIVRNPCGTINSWRKAPKEFRAIDGNFDDQWYFAQQRDRFNPNEYFGFHKWKEATMIFLTLKEWYPEKVHIISYEELSRNTIDEVQKLFSFAKLNLTDQTLNFLNKSVREHNNDEYSVFKGNKRTDEWKDELNPEIIERINNELKSTPFEQFLK